MEYQVELPHVFRDNRGNPLPKVPGDRVDVSNRSIAKQLLAQGTIKPLDDLIPSDLRLRAAMQTPGPLSVFTCQHRVGFCVHTSPFYSGGRVHLYQYAHALASLGVKVDFFTESMPIWAADYPKLPNLEIRTAITSVNQLPVDLDVLITDGKDSLAKIAMEYRRKYPRTQLAVLNFETPNWLALYHPRTASRMSDIMPALKAADILMANSTESAKYLREFVNLPKDHPVYILPPAVNTYAAKKADTQRNPVWDILPEGAPYVAWSARSSAYKRFEDVIAAVEKFPGEMHLVPIGMPKTQPKGTSNHKVVYLPGKINDATKFTIFRDAKAVLAPSLFEGYGMVPGESIAMGTRPIAYTLPVLTTNYGDEITYAKHGDAADFFKVVQEELQNGDPSRVDAQKAREERGMENMQKQIAAFPFHILPGQKRVTAQIICYHGPTIQQAIKAIYNDVDEIVIAHGPVALWKDVPPDNSLKLIKEFPDPGKKIKLEARALWKDKSEMRTWCHQNSTGNRMLIVDADEIIVGLDKWLELDPQKGSPRWFNFWHNKEHYVEDMPGMKRWGKSVDNLPGGAHTQYRWSWWRNGCRFPGDKGTRSHCPLDKSLNNYEASVAAVKACPETIIYHLGHVLTPEMMAAKHDFYLARDGVDAGRIARKRIWHQWEGKLGDCGDGFISKVTHELPEIVLEAFEAIEKGSKDATE